MLPQSAMYMLSLGALHGVRWRLLLCMLLCVVAGRRESEYMESHNLFFTCFNSFKILQLWIFFASDFSHLTWWVFDLLLCLMWASRESQIIWKFVTFQHFWCDDGEHNNSSGTHSPSARHGYQIFSSSMNQGGNGKSHDVKQQQDRKGGREKSETKVHTLIKFSTSYLNIYRRWVNH